MTPHDLDFKLFRNQATCHDRDVVHDFGTAVAINETQQTYGDVFCAPVGKSLPPVVMVAVLTVAFVLLAVGHRLMCWRRW